MKDEEMLNRVGEFMLAVTKQVLSENIPSRAFNGQNKPIRGQFPNPQSPKIASGTYINSLQYKITKDEEDDLPVITIYSTLPENKDYGKFIDQGRSNNRRFPNLELIAKWISQKGIQPKPLAQRRADGSIRYRIPSLKQLNFLISRSIAEQGIFPYPYESIAKARIEKEIRKRMEPVVAQEITRIIRERIVFIINPTRRIP